MRLFNRNIFAAALLFLPAALQAAGPQTPEQTPAQTPEQTPAPTPAPTPALPLKFEIRLLVTAEPAKVFRPTKGANGQPNLAEPVKVVPKGKEIAAVVFFQGCTADPAGNCNVEVDLKGVDPHGTTFQDNKNTKLWVNRPAPHAGVVQLGSAFMKLQFEAGDPPGVYKIFAVAHDHVSGAESSSEASFEVK